jgi:HSP20 family protein
MGFRRLSIRYGFLQEPSDFGLPWSAQLPLTFRGARFRPPADLFETHDGLTLKLELAGMEERDFKISLEAGLLIVEGERRWEPPCEEACCRAVEVHYGPFRVEAAVGEGFSAAQIQAHYDRGFLTVRLSKQAEGQR